MNLRSRNVFRSKSGFTLIETMMATGFAGATSLALLAVMNNVNKTSSFAKTTGDFENLKTIVGQVVNSNQTCGPALGITKTSPLPITALKSGTAAINHSVTIYLPKPAGDTSPPIKLAEKNAPFGNVYIEDVYLSLMSTVPNDVPGVGKNYTAKLWIKGSRMMPEADGKIDYKSYGTKATHSYGSGQVTNGGNIIVTLLTNIDGDQIIGCTGLPAGQGTFQRCEAGQILTSKDGTSLECVAASQQILSVTEKQCRKAGAILGLSADEKTNMCIFPGRTCPSGWGQYCNYVVQTSNCAAGHCWGKPSWNNSCVDGDSNRCSPGGILKNLKSMSEPDHCETWWGSEGLPQVSGCGTVNSGIGSVGCVPGPAVCNERTPSNGSGSGVFNDTTLPTTRPACVGLGCTLSF